MDSRVGSRRLTVNQEGVIPVVGSSPTPSAKFMLPVRLMVRLLPLEQRMGVRLPHGQPKLGDVCKAHADQTTEGAQHRLQPDGLGNEEHERDSVSPFSSVRSRLRVGQVPLKHSVQVRPLAADPSLRMWSSDTTPRCRRVSSGLIPDIRSMPG